MNSEQLETKLTQSGKFGDKRLAKKMNIMRTKKGYNSVLDYKKRERLNEKLYSKLLDFFDEKTKSKVKSLDQTREYIEKTIYNRTKWYSIDTKGFKFEDNFINQDDPEFATHDTYEVFRNEDGYYSPDTGLNNQYGGMIEERQEAFLKENEKALRTLHECLTAREEIFSGKYNLKNENDRELVEQIIDYLKLAPEKENRKVK